MPATLTGTAADPTTSPQTTIAADGDAANSADLQVTPIQPILNFIAWLRTHIAQKDAANTFSAAQTIAALLTLNTTDLDLTAATLQKILKTGGTLQVGTGDANEVDLLVNGVVKLALLVAGGIDAKTQKIVNVVDPASAQDAATKHYVDPFRATSWAQVQTGAGGAATILQGMNVGTASWTLDTLSVNVSGAGTPKVVVCGMDNASAVEGGFLYRPGNYGGGMAVSKRVAGTGASANFVANEIIHVVGFGG